MAGTHPEERESVVEAMTKPQVVSQDHQENMEMATGLRELSNMLL